MKLPPNRVTDYWHEHYVCEETGLCSLCGNTGVINTIHTAISPAGVRAGRKNYCICPNGQALRAAIRQALEEERR